METINKYGEDVTEEIESVGGFSKQEIEEFVYNNRARYYAVFKKNENKRFFLHFNWAALLLSVYWMFYRKMYVEGIVFMLVSTLLSACLLTVSGYAVAAAKVPIQEQYTAAISAGDLTGAAQPEKQLDEEVDRIIFKAVAVLGVFALCWGLIADWLYRNYVFRKVAFSDGGVSRVAIFGAFGLMLLSNIIVDMVKDGLLNTLT